MIADCRVQTLQYLELNLNSHYKATLIELVHISAMFVLITIVISGIPV